MFFYKKILIYLYIFFIFLTFNFIEFSTNKVLAKTFVISKVEVEEKYNLNFNKQKILDRGFKKAFQDLTRMILERKDIKKIENTPIDDIKKLIENFSILDEKFVNKKYKNIMEVQFNRKKLIKFFNSKNIISSLPKNIDVLFLPILVDLKENNFNYLNDNIFAEDWKNVEKNYFQINYILPNEDAEDYLSIKKNLQNIENYNFEEIFKKYNSKNYIIMIIFKEDNSLKFYSKIRLDDKLILLNEKFVNKNINDKSELYSLILKIKNKFEDNWKSINKMNPSESVPIRLSVETYNIKKSLNLEKILSNLDFVNDYRIEKFDSNVIVYKISYGSSPSRFLKDILSKNIYIDTSSLDWKVQ